MILNSGFRMKKNIDLPAAIGFFLLSAAVLLSVIDTVAFSRSFYRLTYDRLNTAEDIGMSEEDLYEATDVLLDYLQGKRDDIDFEAEVNGGKQEIFSTKEALHMEDVRTLYQNSVKAQYLLYAVSLILILLTAVKERKKMGGNLSDSYRYGILLTALCMGFITLLAAVDFYDFWINFHELFFDNDLFYLDPNTSIMINMFPQEFFVRMVACIIIVTVLIYIILGIVLHTWKKKERENAERCTV